MRRKDRQFGEVSEKTRKNMQKIRSKDTSIEVALRKRLWHDGYRYRKDLKDAGFTDDDIAGMMDCKPGEVRTMLSALRLMDEYLDEYGYSGMYTQLDKSEDSLNGYILHVDLAPVRELVSLQRRCANNLNQVAVHANTFGVYPEEIAGLQRDYEKLWGRVSDVLTELSALVEK